MKHIDLFSGIGGFALACEWAGIETVCFCEIDPFCWKVLKKYWPDVPIVKDVNNVEEIEQIIANTTRRGIQARPEQSSEAPNIRGLDTIRRDNDNGLLLTAGFPCQPFSAAGRRKGSADDRYLWPQTLAVIEAVKPNWVVLENVAGILSMVFPDSSTGVASQASFCEVPNDEIADYDTIAGRIDGNLRQAGYETVWLVIPACAVNAPHRRDRVWIVAHTFNSEYRRWGGQVREADSIQGECGQTLGSRVSCGTGCDASYSCEGRLAKARAKLATAGVARNDTRFTTQSQSGESRQSSKQEGREDSGRGNSKGWDVADPSKQGLQGAIAERAIPGGCLTQCNHIPIPRWAENWYEVATRFCRVDDGIPNRVDRVERLKALGNAIVPQVAYQIIKAIALISTTESECLNSDTKAQQITMA